MNLDFKKIKFINNIIKYFKGDMKMAVINDTVVYSKEMFSNDCTLIDNNFMSGKIWIKDAISQFQEKLRDYNNTNDLGLNIDKDMNNAVKETHCNAAIQLHVRIGKVYQAYSNGIKIAKTIIY